MFVFVRVCTVTYDGTPLDGVLGLTGTCEEVRCEPTQSMPVQGQEVQHTPALVQYTPFSP